MKKFLLLAVVFLGLQAFKANAFITVTAGTGGTNICASLAVGGSSPAFTTLGNITITEGANNDITAGAHALVITAPAGWQFNTAAPPTYTFTAGRNITSVTGGAFTATSLTINVNTGGTTLIDAFNIIGLQVQATSTASAAGNITASSAPGMFGIFVGFPSFAALSLSALPNAVTVVGAGTYCGSGNITASLVGAGTIYYQGVQSGGVSVATPSASQLILTAGTNTYYFRARSAAGCWGPEGSAKVTINNPPSGLTAFPLISATICEGDSATVVAGAIAPNVELLQQDFNSGLGSWVITNTAGNATSFFQIRNSPGYNSIAAGDGSPYIQAAPDAAAGITTTTLFTSPAFSTVGYTSASLSFNQYFQTYVSDTTVAVEYSTDGTTWTPFLDQLGATAGFTSWLSTAPNTTIALPAGALGQPSVQLRWNYKSLWGWYWAVDNIKVTGTPTLTYDWSGPAGLSCFTCDTVVITPAAFGTNTYTVSSTVAGCAATSTIDIISNPLPLPFMVTGGGNYCAGGVGLNVLLSGSEAGINYDLYTGGSVVTSLSGTGLPLDFGPQTTAGTYTVMGTNPGSLCASPMTDSAVIVVNPLPSPITGPTSLCEGDTIVLVDTTAGGTWSSTDITVANVDASGNVIGMAGGVADISYILTATGCGVANTVTVNALPVVSAITGTTSLCVGSTTTLSNATPLGVWSSGASTIASIDAAGLVTAVAAGVTTISYSVTDGFGCTGIATTPDTVSAAPPSTIMPAGTYVTLCHGLNANLVGTLIAGATYQWSMGGTPIAGATDHNYHASVPGIYTLDMVNGACSWTLPAKTVLAAPNAVISYNMTGNYLYTGSFTTYQWFRNTVAIPGATSSILFSPTGGNYTVVVGDVTGCTDTSEVYNIASTGFNTVTTSVGVKVYPNPTSSMLYIDAPANVSMSIMTPDGRMVMEHITATSINVSGLANGVYMIRVYDENNVLLKAERFSKID